MHQFHPKPILGFTIAVCVLAGVRIIIDGGQWGREVAVRTSASTPGVTSKSVLLTSPIGDLDDGVAGGVAGLPSAGTAHGAPSSFEEGRAARVEAYDGQADRSLRPSADSAILERLRPGPSAGDGAAMAAPVLRSD